MEPAFWLEKWEKGDIGFHQEDFHPFLKEFGSEFFKPFSSVFVPLCGKSLDMIYFLQQGKQVIGVELAELACEQFFSENQIPFEKKELLPFQCYAGESIVILQGDFFQLEKTHFEVLGFFPQAIYDRAALVALPPSMRKAYVTHLKALLPESATFLISFDFPSDEGPPFSVPQSEIQQLWGMSYHVQLVASKDRSEFKPHCNERLYFIHAIG